ncbi:MAG: acetylornithine transaminase [Gammaproteobacteria bacterium AqS3]|nr:acetylornithine transaminase [Gammaproteobacteria bacterium AqS3]
MTQPADTHLLPTYTPADFVAVRGAGSTLWDQDGRDYIDLGGGIAVTALGHSHPELVEVVRRQSDRLWHLSNWLPNEFAPRLAGLLCARTFAEQVFFSNSGAEANEAALKMARRHHHDRGDAERVQIIAFEGAFHGRTLLTVTAGGKYTEGFGPLPGGIAHVPFNDAPALERQLRAAPTAAVIIEPVLGEGGVVPVDPGFIAEVRRLCDAHGALLIFDEVQSGMGRSGALFMYQQLGVEPDILTSAKALGSGFPIGATLTRAAIGDCMQPGTHGSTFGGNPLACAVALRTLELLDDEVLAGVEPRAQRITEFLTELGGNRRLFSQVRRTGLLIGAELGPDWAGRAMDLVRLGWRHGLLTLPAGADVLRFAPALNISDDELGQGLDRLSQVVGEFVQGG